MQTSGSMAFVISFWTVWSCRSCPLTVAIGPPRLLKRDWFTFLAAMGVLLGQSSLSIHSFNFSGRRGVLAIWHIRSAISSDTGGGGHCLLHLKICGCAIEGRRGGGGIPGQKRNLWGPVDSHDRHPHAHPSQIDLAKPPPRG